MNNLFMTHYDTNPAAGSIWLIDCGCSNHMTGKRELFQELDESQKMKVRLGDDKEYKWKEGNSSNYNHAR